MKSTWCGIVATATLLAACNDYTNLGNLVDAGDGGSDDNEGGAGTGGSGGSSGGAAGSDAGKGGAGRGGAGRGGKGGSSAGDGGSPAIGGGGSRAGVGGSNGGVAGVGGNAAMSGGGSGASAGGPPSNGGGGSAAGIGGAPVGEGGGSGGAEPTDPYAARSGTFNMLVMSRTRGGYRHTAAINAGQELLNRMAFKEGFSVTFTEDPQEFTLSGLSKYEAVFFLNTTGDPLDPVHEVAFEEWMTTKNGAFIGVHSATDTESNWLFYKEVTGQYHDNHTICCTEDNIVIAPSAQTFPAMLGLPNPWRRAEEWFVFNSWQVWSAKPGFTILATKASNGQPVAWTRQWGNFRSFYTSLGHEGATYEDPLFERHLAGGILWAVRREHAVE